MFEESLYFAYLHQKDELNELTVAYDCVYEGCDAYKYVKFTRERDGALLLEELPEKSEMESGQRYDLEKFGILSHMIDISEYGVAEFNHPDIVTKGPVEFQRHNKDKTESIQEPSS